MQAWFKRITENKPGPRPYPGLSPQLRDLLIRAGTAETLEQQRAVYWESLARLGGDLGDGFRISSELQDPSREHSLSIALMKAGYMGIACSDNVCKRGGTICKCLDKYGYGAMIQENKDHDESHVLVMAAALVGPRALASIPVSDEHNICHISAAMVIYDNARGRKSDISAYAGKIRFGYGAERDTPEEFKRKLEMYCRDRNFDII